MDGIENNLLNGHPFLMKYKKELDEFDKNEWTIYGDCDTTLVINKPNTVELTCASIVNRIPDVINAPAGFVPTSRMGELKYIKKES